MRRRNVKNIDERIKNANNNIITNPEKYYGKWQSLFNNKNPIYLEIGCGKGDFIIEHALKNPNINYIAMELFPSVIIRAHDKLNQEHLPNLYFVIADANNILTIFAEAEISHLFLNFSDPWPKKRHAKRRLTSESFLAKYQIILKENSLIEFKTDNQELFAYSVMSLNNFGLLFYEVDVDLHHHQDDIIQSEYEKKFAGMGSPIYYLKAGFKSHE